MCPLCPVQLPTRVSGGRQCACVVAAWREGGEAAAVLEASLNPQELVPVVSQQPYMRTPGCHGPPVLTDPSIPRADPQLPYQSPVCPVPTAALAPLPLVLCPMFFRSCVPFQNLPEPSVTFQAIPGTLCIPGTMYTWCSLSPLPSVWHKCLWPQKHVC